MALRFGHWIGSCSLRVVRPLPAHSVQFTAPGTAKGTNVRRDTMPVTDSPRHARSEGQCRSPGRANNQPCQVPAPEPSPFLAENVHGAGMTVRAGSLK
jgi:hypothetical protein